MIQALGLPDAAREEGFRRMVFNVLAANCDDHTENLAFMLDEQAQWQLTPAYDVTHTYNPKGEWEIPQHHPQRSEDSRRSIHGAWT